MAARPCPRNLTQKLVARVWWAWYVDRMTTTTCFQTTDTIPCRCGHFDRTVRHSCQLTRRLAAHRIELLTAIRSQDAAFWSDAIDWDADSFERFAARVEGHRYDDEQQFEDWAWEAEAEAASERAYAEMLERRAEMGSWFGRD